MFLITNNIRALLTNSERLETYTLKSISPVCQSSLFFSLISVKAVSSEMRNSYFSVFMV